MQREQGELWSDRKKYCTDVKGDLNIMLKKRFTSLFTALALLSAMTAPAVAVEENALEVNQATPGPIVVGILTDDRGDEYEIAGVLVENAYSAYGMTPQEEISATYRFDVPTLTAGDLTSTKDGPDTGYASHIWLTISYRTRFGNTGMEYLMTGASGHWTITDPNVLVKSTNLVCGCSGGITSQTTLPGCSVTNPFDVPTGFKYYVPDNGGILGAILTLEYMMGTRTWSFEMKNLLFDYPDSID